MKKYDSCENNLKGHNYTIEYQAVPAGIFDMGKVPCLHHLRGFVTCGVKKCNKVDFERSPEHER